MRRETGNSTNARDRCNEGVVYGDGVVMAQDGLLETERSI